MTSKATIIDNGLLKKEIRALCVYISRDEYNLNVVEVMVNEIQDIIEGLKPLEEKTDSPTMCPKCHSINVQCMYGTINLDGSGNLKHYICKDCYKEFEV